MSMAEDGGEESMVRVRRASDRVSITVPASALKDSFIVDFAALLREPHLQASMGARGSTDDDGDKDGDEDEDDDNNTANRKKNNNDDDSEGDNEDRNREDGNKEEDGPGAAASDADEQRKRGEERESRLSVETGGRQRATKRRRRRREEGEEYDLNDPFIDDTEVPPEGATLRELLAMDIAEGDTESMMAVAAIDGGEPAPPIMRPDDFYVWRGPLPVRQVDPLWLERAMEAVAAARSGAKRDKKRRRTLSTMAKSKTTAGKAKTRTKEPDSSSMSEREQNEKDRRRRRNKGDAGNNSPRAKKARREENATEGRGAKGKRMTVKRVEATGESPGRIGGEADGEGTAPKGKLSIMDRIVALGDVDGDEQMQGTMAISMSTSSARPINEREEKGRREGEGDGKGDRGEEVVITMRAEEGGEKRERERGEGSEEERVRKRYDYTTPYLELEESLAMAAVRETASRTDFSDPKKFPSPLRPYVNEAIVCCLRRQERKDQLPESFFTSLASMLPFTSGSLQKLTYTKLITLYRDELALKVIPQMLDELRDEAHVLAATTATMTMASEETGSALDKSGATTAITGKGATGVSANVVDESNDRATTIMAKTTTTTTTTQGTKRFNEKIRQLLVDLVKCELDRQALDRLITVQVAGGRYVSLSETSCRKAFYPRIVACWPGEGLGGPSTVEVAREYTTARRRVELRLLKEHHIEVQPTLIPIGSSGTSGAHGKGTSAKSDAGAGNGGRLTEEPSRVASQLDSQADLPPPEGEREGEGETETETGETGIGHGEKRVEGGEESAIMSTHVTHQSFTLSGPLPPVTTVVQPPPPAAMVMDAPSTAITASPSLASSSAGGKGGLSTAIVTDSKANDTTIRYPRAALSSSSMSAPPPPPAPSSFLETVVNENLEAKSSSDNDPDRCV